MPLLVKYEDDGTGYLTKHEFEQMLTTGKIAAFMRSSGEWVNPNIGPIRGHGISNVYTGPNRRSRF
jgi:hypothetical protein